MGERAERDTRWVDGRLRRVRDDGTLGATCLHGVGLTAGLWCGACMDLDPRVLPEPPVTADHTPERLSAADREKLEKRVREWMRSTSESYIWPVGSDAWVRGLVGYLASGPNSVDRILAALLADVEARLAAVEALLTQWRHDLLTNPPTSMRDLGWVQGVEEALGQIEAALHPTPSEQPAQGGVDT